MNHVSTKRRAFPARGPSSSKELNDHVDQVATDINAISQSLTRNESDIQNAVKLVLDEMRYVHRRLSQIESDIGHQKKISANNGLRTTIYQSMYKVDNLSFIGTNNALRTIVSPQFGIAHLPSNAVESKFFSNSIYNGDVITPASLSVDINTEFIPENSSALTNFDQNAQKVIEGIPKNAFNGNNRSYWIREVEFPASSDITEYQTEVIVTLPSQNNTKSNVLTIHPYPLGSVDIIDISTSPDLSSSFTKLQHSNAPSITAPMNNAQQTKFIFPPQDIDQIRVRLRTRNFVEENGKKIFRLGLQELGLFLVDFEKSNASLEFSDWSATANEDNVSMVHEIRAPAGFFFTAIHHFDSTPDITLENDLNRHVIFRIYDGDPSVGAGNELWSSNKTYPQNQPDSVGGQVSLAGSASSLYVVTNMRYVDSSGGVNSPFSANTTPYLQGFSMEVSMKPSF